MKKLKNSWDTIAESWTKQWTTHMEPWQFNERVEFAEHVGNGLILDLGCGPGKDMNLFFMLGLDCIGLDFSMEMLKWVNDPSVCASMIELPFQSNKFDGVWSCSAMKYLSREGMLIALKEVRRVLKPDGVFWLGLDEGEGEIVEDRNGEMLILHLYTEKVILPYLEEAGFEIISRSRIATWRKFLNLLLK